MGIFWSLVLDRTNISDATPRRPNVFHVFHPLVQPTTRNPKYNSKHYQDAILEKYIDNIRYQNMTRSYSL